MELDGDYSDLWPKYLRRATDAKVLDTGDPPHLEMDWSSLIDHVSHVQHVMSSVTGPAILVT